MTVNWGNTMDLFIYENKIPRMQPTEGTWASRFRTPKLKNSINSYEIQFIRVWFFLYKITSCLSDLLLYKRPIVLKHAPIVYISRATETNLATNIIKYEMKYTSWSSHFIDFSEKSNSLISILELFMTKFPYG